MLADVRLSYLWMNEELTGNEVEFSFSKFEIVMFWDNFCLWVKHHWWAIALGCNCFSHMLIDNDRKQFVTISANFSISEMTFNVWVLLFFSADSLNKISENVQHCQTCIWKCLLKWRNVQNHQQTNKHSQNDNWKFWNKETCCFLGVPKEKKCTKQIGWPNLMVQCQWQTFSGQQPLQHSIDNVVSGGLSNGLDWQKLNAKVPQMHFLSIDNFSTNQTVHSVMLNESQKIPLTNIDSISKKQNISFCACQCAFTLQINSWQAHQTQSQHSWWMVMQAHSMQINRMKIEQTVIFCVDCHFCSHIPVTCCLGNWETKRNTWVNKNIAKHLLFWYHSCMPWLVSIGWSGHVCSHVMHISFGTLWCWMSSQLRFVTFENPFWWHHSCEQIFFITLHVKHLPQTHQWFAHFVASQLLQWGHSFDIKTTKEGTWWNLTWMQKTNLRGTQDSLFVVCSSHQDVKRPRTKPRTVMDLRCFCIWLNGWETTHFAIRQARKLKLW